MVHDWISSVSEQAPEISVLHYGAWALVRPIVSAAVHGKTRSRTDFHGSLDIEMVKFIYFPNAQIYRNFYKLVHGERTHVHS